MVKKTILKFIRNKQQQRYNDTHEPHKPDSRTYESHTDPTSDSVIPPPPAPPSEFEESLKYLTDIANETKPPQNNTTLKKQRGMLKTTNTCLTVILDLEPELNPESHTQPMA
jgi:hypothetical protein